MRERDVLEDNDHLLLWDTEMQEWVEAKPPVWVRLYKLLLLSVLYGVGLAFVAIVVAVFALVIFAGSAFLAVVIGTEAGL